MPTRGQTLFLCTLALLVVGVVMVNSAGLTVSPVPEGVAGTDAVSAEPALGFADVVTSRSAVYTALALAAMGIAAAVPVGRIAERVIPSPHAPVGYLYAGLLIGVLLLAALLVLVYVPGLRRTVNYSTRWIALPVVGSIQPSEIVKWAMIPLLAAYAAAMGPRLGRLFKGLIPALAAVGLIAVIIVVEDLGTGVLVAVSLAVLLLAAGAKILHYLAFAPFAALGVVAAIVESPYRLERITSFFNPFADARESGYQMIQSMVTVAGGGLVGRGLGHGIQKFGYLPEDTTDFLFAVICEEAGLAGATIIIALYLVMAWTLVGIVRDQTTPVLRLYTVGVLATLLGQAMINLVVVTGLGPTKGIALPLLSSGGTGWVLTAASLGLVIAIDRDTRAGLEASPILERPPRASPLPAPA